MIAKDCTFVGLLRIGIVLEIAGDFGMTSEEEADSDSEDEILV